MSAVRESFLMAARARDWRSAFMYLNGLNMEEMLSGLDTLDGTILQQLADLRAAYAERVNMPRIEYALFVVQQSMLPAYAPGDLASTSFSPRSQVQDAVQFLANRKSPRTPTVLDLGGGIVVMAFPQIMINDFVDGLIVGAKSRLSSDLLLHLEKTILLDPVGFQTGYARGCLGGLLTGLKNLAKTVIDIFGLAIAFSPPVLMWKLQREAFMLLTSAAHRELRKQQIAWAKAIVGIIEDTIADIALHPNNYLIFSSDAGVALGQFAGTWIADDFLQRPASQIGEALGSVVGQVAFEIIIQLLLAAFTEGAGNAARAGMEVGEGVEAARAGIALGQGAEGGARIAGLAQRLKGLVMSCPGLQKLIRILTAEGMSGERAIARGAEALLDAELELALGEGAVLQRGASGGFPVLERLPELSTEARTAAAKLLGQEFSPELQAAWNACSNPKAVSELAEVQRLLKTGSAADREAAYALSERTYVNWRTRFWTRVRGDTSLKKIFVDAGASFDGKSGAPYFKLASNLFSNASGQAYLGEEWLILGKAPMYNGQAFSFRFFSGMMSGGVLTDTTQPVNVWSPYDNPRAEFLITSKDFFCTTGCNGLTIWAISNPFGFVTGGPTPELSSVVIATVNNYSQPPNAVQLGTSTLIDTNDTRISGEATYQSGSIYASNESANGTGGVSSLIYRVQPQLNVNDGARCTGAFLNLCPQITGATELNESVINGGTTTAAYFAVPQPDLEGNVNTVFTFSSTTDYATLAYTSQRVTQANNTFVAAVFLQAGSAPAYTQGRWGDYNAVAPAGVAYAAGNGGNVATPGFGFSGMYASGNTWRTRIGFNKFSGPGQP